MVSESKTADSDTFADIRVNADGGHPSVTQNPDSPASAIYREIACRTAAKFPNIVIQNN